MKISASDDNKITAQSTLALVGIQLGLAHLNCFEALTEHFVPWEDAKDLE